MEGNSVPIIIDIGSYTTKIQYANSQAPIEVNPIIAQYLVDTHDNIKGILIGNQLEKNIKSFTAVGKSFAYPIIDGEIKSSSNFCTLIEKCLEGLNATTENPIMISEYHHNEKLIRQVTEYLFEKLNYKKLCAQQQTLLDLYSNGQSTGIVVDCGHEITQFASYEDQNGTIGPTKSKSFANYFIQKIAGRSVSIKLKELLRKDANPVKLSDLEALEEMKKSCWVKEHIILPDKNQVAVKNSYADACDILFDKKAFSLANSLFKYKAQAILYQNIILCGGTTKLGGLKERLQNDLSVLTAGKAKIGINQLEMPQHSSWIGGASLSKLSSFNWNVNKDYKDYSVIPAKEAKKENNYTVINPIKPVVVEEVKPINKIDVYSIKSPEKLI